MSERIQFAGKGLATAREDVVGRSVLDADIATPLMIVRRSALEANIALLAAYCRQHSVFLSPHAKTTMCPEIVSRQRQAGAWAITVTSVSQAIALGPHAGGRILIANEVVDTAGIAWLNSLIAGRATEVYCYVDSLRGVQRLASGITSGILDVLVEVGPAGGRCGVRSTAAAHEVAAAVTASRSLRLAGVATFEGIMAREQRGADEDHGLRTFLRHVHDVARGLAGAGAFRDVEEIILTAGGSCYFDLVVEELARPLPGCKTRVVIRSGCYVTHDHGAIARLSPFRELQPTFQPAIEVLSSVLSRPEPKLAICDIGRRDVPFDAGLPVALWKKSRTGAEIQATTPMTLLRLNDQHAYLQLLRPDVDVGDIVSFGISHPCTAFDKWRVIPLVNDELKVVELMHTVF